MLQDIPLVEGPVSFDGAISLERVDGGIHPFRLLSDDRPLHDPGLIERADAASGVRMVVATDSTTAEVDVTLSHSGDAAYIDAVAGGELLDSQGATPTGSVQTYRFENLPPGQKRLEFWLPQFGATTVHALRLAEAAKAEMFSDTRRRWISYGSSITMCRQAHSPARTWPATVARIRDLNLLNMGYGGQCHFDPLVARTIRDLPADFISLKLGINTHGASTFTSRSWAPAVIGFILTVRDGHPETPLLVCSPVFSRGHEDQPNRAGMTVVEMRSTLIDIVGKLRQRGDGNIHYLNGLELLGQDDIPQSYLPDNIHPNGDGYELIGKRFSDLAFGPAGPFRL